MEKEKTDILRRKMIKSGLAALATGGMAVAVLVPKSNAQQCSGNQCVSCSQGCQSCAVCNTCQYPSSKGEPEE